MTKKITETSMDLPAGTDGKNAAYDWYYTGGIIFWIAEEDMPE